MSHIEAFNELNRLLHDGDSTKILDIVTRIEQILNIQSGSHETSNVSRYNSSASQSFTCHILTCYYRDLRNVAINLLDRVFGETTTGYEASTRAELIPRSNGVATEVKNAGKWNSNKDGWLYELNGKLDISEFSSLKTPRKSEKSGSNSSMKLVHLLSANHINYNPSASNTPGSKSASATGTPVTPASLGGYAASVQYTPFMQHFRQSFNNGDLFQLKLSLLPRKARSVITHSLTHSLAY